MVEHCSLEFQVFHDERHRLDLLRCPDISGVGWLQGWDFFNKPEVGRLEDVLIPVDFLLLIAPIRESLAVGPHCYFRGVVNQFELARHGSEVLV